MNTPTDENTPVTPESDEDLVEIFVPFMGFYGTIAIQLAELYSDYDFEQADDDNKERITKFNYAADYTDWKDKLSSKYVACYCKALNDIATEYKYPQIKFSYSGIQSPRFYNFTTDRIFAKIPRKTIVEYWNIILNDPEFKKCAVEYLTYNFKSRDGFMSNYDYRIEDWIDRGAENFDVNEGGSVLAIVAQHYFNENWDNEVVSDIASDILYEVSWGEEADEIISTININ